MAEETIYNDNLSLDEIVFENRNKAYGAYELRKTYPRVLTKAFILGTLVFVLAVLAPIVVMKIKQMNEGDKQEVDANLINILEEEEPEEQIIHEDEPPPPPPPPKVEEQIEVIQNVVPEPKKAPKVETPPPPISEQLKTTTGVVAQEGVKAPSYAPPPPPPSTGTKTATVEVKPQVSQTEIYDDVEQVAEYPGGINSFRNQFQQSFDPSVMDGDEGTVKSEVTFVVERDGSITQVSAKGSNSYFNKEVERAVKSIKKKWAPAKINGQPVRYRFRMPVTMQFEY